MMYKLLTTRIATVAIAAALIISSQAEVHDQCAVHSTAHESDGGRPKSFELGLDLPGDLPDAFPVELSFSGTNLTLHLEKNRVFGDNTRFLVANGTGSLHEIGPGLDRSYLGRVAERPDFAVSAVLTAEGLIANIIRPGQESITIEPLRIPDDLSLHKISVPETGDHPVCPHGAPAAAQPSGHDTVAVAASNGPITTSIEPEGPAPAPASTSTATLPPSKVMDVLEYEVGVEIGSRAFFASTAYNGNLATAQAVAQTIPGNLDGRYLKATGIKHRLGTVIIRTDAATDPLRDQVTATGAAENASSSLSAFKDYWNSHSGEVGNTHDLAVYHVLSSPSGLSYVNSVGGSYRYATCGGNGATSWADGTLAHEFGHSWNLGHVNDSLFYESKPRDNSGSTSAGGEDVFISIMHGGGDHNIGRLATDEADRVLSARQNKRQYGELVTGFGNVRPYARRDEAATAGGPVTIDVIANDIDVNNDVLDAELLDTVSQQGGTISLSAGTGTGGRNEVIYTPPVGHKGTDFFHYNACEINSGDLKNWGAVYVTNLGATVVDTSLANFHYDLGPLDSVLQSGLTEITPGTTGDIHWTGDAVDSQDRGADTWSSSNRDFVTCTGTAVLSHKVAPGLWRVSLSMGDATEARDQIRVRAEGGQVVREGIASAVGQFTFVEFDVNVTDGFLDLEFSDQGGTMNGWALNRLHITRPPVTRDHIAITNSGSSVLPEPGTVFTLTNFDPMGGNKLVVTTSAEGRGEGRSVAGITFRGIPLDEAVSSNGGRSSAIWYLDSPGTAPGTVTVTWSGETNGCGIGAYALLGARPEGPSFVNSSDGLSSDVAVAADNSIVIASLVANGGSNPTVASPYNLNYGSAIGSAMGAAASTQLATTGTSTVMFATDGATPVTLAAAFSPNEATSYFVEHAGTVTMEAENFSLVEGRKNLPHSWILDDSADGYAGVGYMHVPDGTVDTVSDYPNSARMQYDVNFSNLGSYQIFVRRRALDGAANSVFAGIDGVQSPAIDNGGADLGSWIWVSLGTVNVNKPGLLSVDIVLREDGYQVDRIVLTTGGAPTGDGPPESSRLTPPPSSLSFLELNGSVTMEAENYERRESRDNSFLEWTLATSDSGFSGTGYMEIPDGAAGFLPSHANGSRMIYDVDFDRTGTYTIYVRRRAVHGAANSVYAGFNGVQTSGIDNGTTSTNWVWVSLGIIEVSSPGVFPVDIVLREDGYQVDRIAISSAGIPSGFGPAENPRRNTYDFDTTADDDIDGLSNGYEFRYYGHITDNADEHSDRDHDGSSDLSELIAGTDANENRSVFQISGLSRNGNEITLEWKSVVGKTYTIHQRSDLTSGSWVPIVSNIPSEGSSTSHTVSVDGDRSFFYIGVSDD